MAHAVRMMTLEDIPSARVLWSGCGGVELAEGDRPDQLARYLARNPGLSTVATDEAGNLVGAVLCGHDGRRGFVYHLAVASGCRGHGVGREIMRRSLAGLKAEGIERVLLFVSADNPDGERFWLRQGWQDMSFAKPMGFDL